MKSEKTRIIISLVFIGCISMAFIHPIAQNVSYHSFADTRELLSVPNFWNVISNLPFLVIGIYGIIYLLSKFRSEQDSFHLNYFSFFIGIFLTGMGSAYYHFHPDNNTLVWDRLPMTISFMSFFSIIISEFVDMKKGKVLLLPLLLIGICSVYYWHWTELQDRGDLRLYILVQFLPMFLIPLIMILFKPRIANIRLIWLMILTYALSKLFETFDIPVFEHGHIISGHTIKHLFAALSPFLFLLWIRKEKRQSRPY